MSVSYYGEYRQPRQEGFWHFLNRLLVLLIVFAIIAAIICAFLPLLHKGREQSERFEDLKKEYDAQKAIHAQQTRQINWLNNDPNYVEVLARDRLDLMKDNETIFRLDSQAAPVPAKSRSRSQ